MPRIPPKPDVSGIIARFTKSVATLKVQIMDLTDQIATIDRDRYRLVALCSAQEDTLKLLTGPEEASEPEDTTPPATREKRGVVRAAILEHLAKYPDGVSVAGIVERTGKNGSSVANTLNLLIKDGVVTQAGKLYRLVPQQASTPTTEPEGEQRAAE